MADIPILFSSPMVRALLAGTKTQTRRALKEPYGTMEFVDGEWRPIHTKVAPRDRLWVRESWSGQHEFRDTPPSQRQSFAGGEGEAYFRESVWYWADGNPDFGDWERPRPSIHMPRYASRITLFVEDVKVERLQEISREDAIAEGLTHLDWLKGTTAAEMGCDWGFDGDSRHGSPVSAYAALWDHINGEGAWATNPFVVAYTFKVVLENIDYIGKAAA